MFSKPKLLFLLFISSIALTGCGSGDNSLIDLANDASGGKLAIVAIIVIILFFVFALVSARIQRNKKKNPPKS